MYVLTPFNLFSWAVLRFQLCVGHRKARDENRKEIDELQKAKLSLNYNISQRAFAPKTPKPDIPCQPRSQKNQIIYLNPLINNRKSKEYSTTIMTI